MTIVGVVGNIRHQSLAAEPGPDIYKPASQLAWKQMHYLVRLRPDAEQNPLSFFPTLRREISNVAPEVGVFNPVSLDDELADSLWQPRLRAWLLGFFSCFALLLAASGLYGVVAFGVAQRKREIGIRLALGATTGGVLKLVVRQGMRAVVIGLGLGVAVSWTVARGLEAALYGVGGTDPWSYAGASLLLLVASLLACWLPARSAARISPGEALRSE
jgi:putative ABC transport system permease protein